MPLPDALETAGFHHVHNASVVLDSAGLWAGLVPGMYPNSRITLSNPRRAACRLRRTAIRFHFNPSCGPNPDFHASLSTYTSTRLGESSACT